MNCREVQKLLSAERDGVLDDCGAALLEEHVSGCATCRRSRALLAESAASWIGARAAVKIPDAEVEWRAVRRRIRTGEASTGSRRSIPAGFGWAGAGIALAVLAVGVFVGVWKDDVAQPRVFAQVESVEVSDRSATSMVFVDEQTGWLVVWSVSKDGGES